MGRNRKTGGTRLGHAIIRERFKKIPRKSDDSFLHTSELKDGYDWGRLNLQSVTEQNDLDEFLNTAELAGTEFTAEKLNVKIVSNASHTGLPTAVELKKIADTQEEHRDLLRIPRRPDWDASTTRTELEMMERTSFFSWRKDIAALQDLEGITITPFEKNLEFWRQLWRVIERSDIVVQIVDARNPLLFRCEDMEKYVKEVGQDKKCLLLVNKSDLLTSSQRQYWSEYFAKHDILAVFWSALDEAEKQAECEEAEDPITQGSLSLAGKRRHLDTEGDGSEDDATGEDVTRGGEVEKDEEDSPSSDGEGEGNQPVAQDSCEECADGTANTLPQVPVNPSSTLPFAGEADGNSAASEGLAQGSLSGSAEQVNPGVLRYLSRPYDLVSGEQLVDLLKHLPQLRPSGHRSPLIVGLVGYPNVGKSSTINAILKAKKVAVSATPGRTKHFQTMYVDKELMLCDCPGLVMPSFVSTKAEMIVSGILPIDQMRDHVPAVSLVCQRVPKATLESIYGIIFPLPAESEDPHRKPTSRELCVLYGCQRGFMTTKGVVDEPRTARLILKDYVKGRLLYPHPPPGCHDEEFCPTPVLSQSEAGASGRQEKGKSAKGGAVGGARGVAQATGSAASREVDRQFFSEVTHSVHQLGICAQGKTRKHGGAKKKKEKLRKKYAHLDQHQLL